MSEAKDNVGIALALVVGAGASTGLGAAVVFFPSVVKLASRRVLASSLGFSAGVMTYVSFVEILSKAQGSFQDAGFEENLANIYSTLCFFGGVIIMMLLNFLVAKLLGGHSPSPNTPVPPARETVKTESAEEMDQPTCCTKDPVGRLEKIKKMADDLEHEEKSDDNNNNNHNHDICQTPDDLDDDFVDNLPLEESSAEEETVGDVIGNNNEESNGRGSKEEKKKLVKMGMNTALAIGLHNFPEGLATFVAALNDPTVGAILAFAIAIHNIPEGLCVALPIYYATGNRKNAFLWALLSGASEIIAALLGWAVLASAVDDTTYAILFGLVAGMMVIISIRELLPTAHGYDPEDTVVTYSFIGGMLLMALSLIMFII